MADNYITHIQLFGIGFSFGIIGPCLFVCAPILVTYVAGTKKKWHEALADVGVFLAGRLVAYLVLGCLAGLSGALIRRFTGPSLTGFLKPIAGCVSIILGITVFFYNEQESCAKRSKPRIMLDYGGFIALGFLVGIAPCAPLVALLFEIVLISKNAIDGMLYTLSFGLGTLVSGFITVGTIVGILSWFPPKFFKSARSSLIFRIICAVLLILFGLNLIIKGS